MSNWFYDSKTTKWQITIGTIFIAIIFISTFAFLDTYEFETWAYSGFTKSIMGILMGTVALGVITGIIIIFQSIVSMDREKNQKIFSNRLELYRSFTKKTMEIINDDDITEEELASLKTINMEVLMIASPITYKKWYTLYKPIAEKGKGQRDEKEVRDNTRNMYEFINSCRKDLEIDQIDTSTLDDVIQTAQKGRASYSNTEQDWLFNRKKIRKNLTSTAIDEFKICQKYLSNLEGVSFKYPANFVSVFVENIRFAIIYLNTSTVDIVLSFQSYEISKKSDWEIDNTLSGISYKIKNIGTLNNEMKSLITKAYELAKDKK